MLKNFRLFNSESSMPNFAFNIKFFVIYIVTSSFTFAMDDPTNGRFSPVTLPDQEWHAYRRISSKPSDYKASVFLSRFSEDQQDRVAHVFMKLSFDKREEIYDFYKASNYDSITILEACLAYDSFYEGLLSMKEESILARLTSPRFLVLKLDMLAGAQIDEEQAPYKYPVSFFDTPTREG